LLRPREQVFGTFFSRLLLADGGEGDERDAEEDRAIVHDFGAERGGELRRCVAEERVSYSTATGGSLAIFTTAEVATGGLAGGTVQGKWIAAGCAWARRDRTWTMKYETRITMEITDRPRNTRCVMCAGTNARTPSPRKPIISTAIEHAKTLRKNVPWLFIPDRLAVKAEDAEPR
jgi:hypothetical protein